MNNQKYLEYIHIKPSFLQSTDPNIVSRQKDLYNLLLKTNINEYIDKEKVKSLLDISQYTFDKKELKISNKYIFAQLQGHSNIAEPLQTNNQDYDNLDVLEKTESKFLQGDDNIGIKAEKYVWKLQLTEGINTFFGFEYQSFDDKNNNILKNFNSDTNKYLKVLLGPNIDVHRGVFYLTNDNFKILG